MSSTQTDEPEYTVLGASGFIGSHLAARFRADGVRYFAPPRWEPSILARPLGHCIYCIGLTADWRSHPYDAVRAHVERLLEVVERARYESLLYLSSTRVYKRASAATEETPLVIAPAVPDDLFDVSKIQGESICLSAPASLRVVRLSNVYGRDYRSNNFLSSVMRDAIRGHVTLESNPNSAKDYVSIDDVVDLLPRIASRGRRRIYNVASGENTTHAQVLAALAVATGCSVCVDESAPSVVFPPIAVQRITSEFGFKARSLVKSIGELVEDFKTHRNEWGET